MSNNLGKPEQASGKIYPMDLAPKVTIVKSGMANDGPKLITQTKGPGGGQITHSVPLSLMRPNSQLMSQGVASQMIVSREHVGPLLQGAHIISQGTQLQLSGQGSQIISQGTQLINSQNTQIVAQGTAVGGNVGSTGNTGTTLISSTGALRTIATSVRVLAPLSHSTSTVGTRPTLGVTVTSVSQLQGGGAVARGGTVPSGVATATSGGPGYHVPRGAAAVASLAVPRPASAAVGWSAALVYAPRLHAAASQSNTPTATTIRRQTVTPTQPVVPNAPVSVTVSHSHSLPLPIGQRSYQPSKVLGIRTAVLGNPPATIPISVPPIVMPSSVPSTVPASTIPLTATPPPPTPLSLSAHPAVAALECTDSSGQSQTIQIQVVSSGIAGPGLTGLEVVRSSSVPPPTQPMAPLPTHTSQYTPTSPARPSILRKRDIEGSPLKNHVPNAITALATAINTLTGPSPTPVHHTVYPSSLGAVANLTNVFNSDLRNLANIANSTDHRNLPNTVIGNTAAISTINNILPIPQQPVTLPSPISPAGSMGSGSTTVSADSSPAPSPPPTTRPTLRSSPIPQAAYNNSSNNSLQQPVSPRKKPRKQMLSGADVRQCEGSSSPPSIPVPCLPNSQFSGPPVSHPSPINTPQRMPPPHRRAMLGTSWKGNGGAWRATSRHFSRPTDVRSAPTPRPSLPDPPARRKAAQQADGWKVHHLTATMDDLMELETGVINQLGGVLHKLELRAASLPPAHPPSILHRDRRTEAEGSNGSISRPTPNDMHRLIELVKANMQRSQVVCDNVAEARSEVLSVFRHRALVVDILTRQADKRCFKKHRN